MCLECRVLSHSPQNPGLLLTHWVDLDLVGLSHLQHRPGGRRQGPSHSTGPPFPTWGENHLSGQQSLSREANWEGEERGDVRSWSVCPSLVIPAWKQPRAGEQTSSHALRHDRATAQHWALSMCQPLLLLLFGR